MTDSLLNQKLKSQGFELYAYLISRFAHFVIFICEALDNLFDSIVLSDTSTVKQLIR